MSSLDMNDILVGQKVVDYHNQCLNHLKFSYGIVHAEYIIDDRSGQPLLLEINNRLCGNELPSASHECYHVDEVNLMLDLFEGKSKIDEFSFTKIFSYMEMLYLSNYMNLNATKLDLSSIHSKYKLVVFKPELVTHSNRDSGEVFDEVSAEIWLVNKNEQRLQKELYVLRGLEKNGKLFI
jgi:hypothetical protein